MVEQMPEVCSSLGGRNESTTVLIRFCMEYSMYDGAVDIILCYAPS